MKEMIYKKDFERTVLEEGDYKGYHFVICSLGTHPTAYVEIKREYTENELYSIEVHGGITYGYDHDGHALWTKTDERKYIGWDYAHLSDYSGTYLEDETSNFLRNNCKKWTTEEIYEEVKSVINQLRKNDLILQVNKLINDFMMEIIDETNRSK